MTTCTQLFTDEDHLLKEEFLDLLNHIFLAIIRVDPARNQCLIFSGPSERYHGKKFSYTTLLRTLKRFLFSKDRERILNALSPEALDSYREQQPDSFDFGYVLHGEEHWLSVKVIVDKGSPHAYLLIRKATAYQCLQKDISKMYVYDRCDYFIYLDTQANSYIMFGGSDNSTLPPVICDDYETAIVTYAETFVSPEDKEMCVREMRLAHVCEMLEKNGIHIFTRESSIQTSGIGEKSWNTAITTRNSKKSCCGAQI